jgi:signal transduction histidine kinase/ActR/RegA family two-component response regulator
MTSNRFIYYILVAFIASSLLLLSMQYNSRNNLRRLIGGNEQLMIELNASSELRQAERNIISTESKIRAAVATGDTAYLDGTDQQIAEAKANLDSLRSKLHNDSIRMWLDGLSALATQKGLLKDQVLSEFHTTGRFPPGILINSPLARRDSNKIEKLTRKILESRRQELTSLEAAVTQSGRRLQRLETLLVLFGVCSGALFFWFIINRIIHQNKSIRKLDASEKKVIETARIKENFLANMSHEIRTPLNAILGFSNLLKARNKDPQVAEFAQSIRQSGENLLTIVNDILDISKIEAGMIRIESAPFSIRELIHSVGTMFGERVREKRLTLETSIEGAVPDRLEGDATRLTQILVNLIGNAIKFTDRGVIGVRVCAGERGERGERGELGELGERGERGERGEPNERSFPVKVIVSDNGIGIPHEKLAAIFDRFQQAEDSIARKYGGTGLGLSIVKDLVLLQKGTIAVESRENEGTTFTFTIPYAISTEPFSDEKQQEQPAIPFGGAGNIHLLVVEDNAMNQSLLRHLLSGWQLSFDMVDSGAKALEALTRQSYTLVLMDIQMPEMDGYTTVRMIRQQLRLDLPIVAMTAHALAGEREKCLSQGMNGYIAKPIRETDLYNLIKQLSGPEDDLVTEKPASPANWPDKDDIPVYAFIDLLYMKQISNGNIEYERCVTEEFIEGIPKDLVALESARREKDTNLLKRTAHDMKTSTSIMGLSERLQASLDELEYEDLPEETLLERIAFIRTVCLNALQEARHFYSTL